jgi:hypothetical protein
MFGLPNPYTIGAAAALSLAVTSGAYLKGRTDMAHKRDGQAQAIQVATAQRYAAAAAEMLVTERQRARTSEETAHAYKTDRDDLALRYERLREGYGLRGVPAAKPVPFTPGRSDGGPCGKGFFCLSTGSAVALMLAADENTLKLIDLQGWVRAQQAIGENR